MKHPMTPMIIHLPNSHLHTYLTSASNSCSKINLPSLYCSVDSYARSYFHPTTSLQDTHEISLTICFPVVICRSSGGPSAILTLHPSIPAGGWGKVHFGEEEGFAVLASECLLVRLGGGVGKGTLETRSSALAR